MFLSVQLTSVVLLNIELNLEWRYQTYFCKFRIDTKADRHIWCIRWTPKVLKVFYDVLKQLSNNPHGSSIKLWIRNEGRGGKQTVN